MIKMKILLYDMGAYTQTDIMLALDKMGIGYKNILYKMSDVNQDAYFEKRVSEFLLQETYQAVLSVNYFPVLADICRKFQIPYLSWSYDSPLNVKNIERTLGYETNYVFFFDLAECRKYWNKGVNNVYHLPLAVNTERLADIETSADDKLKYGSDISMVGQLYDTSLPLLLKPLGDYEKGYVSAVLESQLRLYGCYFLEDVITESLMDNINKAYAALGQCALRLERDGFIVSIAKHITHIERTLLLDILSEEHKVDLYGPDKDENLKNVIWHGSAGYFDEMPKVFRHSKINLNVSLKCIQSGVPLRALDIMGNGGFLLTNYQPEIAENFVDGEEVVMYHSIEDAVAKCYYYLEHEEERKQIAKNGFDKVREKFGYEDRLLTMFQTAELLK